GASTSRTATSASRISASSTAAGRSRGGGAARACFAPATTCPAAVRRRASTAVGHGHAFFAAGTTVASQPAGAEAASGTARGSLISSANGDLADAVHCYRSLSTAKRIIRVGARYDYRTTQHCCHNDLSHLSLLGRPG